MLWQKCLKIQNDDRLKANNEERSDMRVKTMYVKDMPSRMNRFPNFHRSGSICGMKREFYGKDALLVRCGSYVYDVSSEPSIYYGLAH